MPKTLLTKIGTLVSGDIDDPILRADAILIEDGKIAAVGSAGELGTAGVTLTIDCGGTTVTPMWCWGTTRPVRSRAASSKARSTGG
jgi:predicted amidohydrolase YtcJ